MDIYQKQSFSNSFQVYFDRRMLRILLLGAISGFPWVIIGSSLSLWLKEEGLSRSTIGWAGLIFAVYAFNYLWAPLIDRIRIPWLTNKVGHRRGWIILMQLIILFSLIFWNFIDPNTNLALVITVGLVIAIFIDRISADLGCTGIDRKIVVITIAFVFRISVSIIVVERGSFINNTITIIIDTV